MVVAEHHLITGPSRGGKSEWAEHQIALLAAGSSVTYLATGPTSSGDASWDERLERHRCRRPQSWKLIEASNATDVASVLTDAAQENQFILLDSLGGIVAAELESDPLNWSRKQELLIGALQGCSSIVVMVAEEVGWGVVPPTSVGGLFRDRNGEFVRRCAQLSKECWLVTAGHALPLHALAQVVPSNH